MAEFIETALNERRSLEQALAEITVKYEGTPPGERRDGLGRMIQQIMVEIARRKAAPLGSQRPSPPAIRHGP
jgi:hypothetical protein